MRLVQLFESDDIWYHGTPEMQKLSQFENRTINVNYISDPDAWEELQKQMSQIENGSPEYFKLIDAAGELQANKSVRSPIFLTNNHSVARSYADDRRAFDYQAAEPGIVKVTVAPANTLEIHAHGTNFRGISVAATTKALQDAGISDEKIRYAFRQFQNSIRGDGNKMSTDSLAALVDHLDFDIIDVRGVKDNYMGGGPPSTVRMVLDANLINIIKD